MLVLGIDTSTSSLTVSLINEKKILASFNSIGTLKHSALLIPTIEKALKKAGSKIEDISLFSIGIGPGSFTGLRVGVTSMRALAIALDKPIVGIPTMDAIAYNGLAFLKKEKTLDGHMGICPILDAKKNQVYACIYSHDGVNIIRETDYLLEPIDMLLKRLKGSILFLGDAIPLYKKELSHYKNFKARFLNDRKWLPKASVIARMGLKQYQTGKSENPFDLVPLYLYARDCQVRK